MPTYDPERSKIAYNGSIIVNFGGSTFMKAERNADAVNLQIGSLGDGCRIINKDKSGTMEITLLASAPANDIFAAIAALDEETGAGFGTFQFQDLNGTATAHAQNAWVKKKPPIQRGKELDEVTWVLETENLDLTQGSISILP